MGIAAEDFNRAFGFHLCPHQGAEVQEKGHAQNIAVHAPGQHSVQHMLADFSGQVGHRPDHKDNQRHNEQPQHDSVIHEERRECAQPPQCPLPAFGRGERFKPGKKILCHHLHHGEGCTQQQGRIRQGGNDGGFHLSHAFHNGNGPVQGGGQITVLHTGTEDGCLLVRNPGAQTLIDRLTLPQRGEQVFEAEHHRRALATVAGNHGLKGFLNLQVVVEQKRQVFIQRQSVCRGKGLLRQPAAGTGIQFV
ncbi:hypothetical protein D3C86_1548830 [compost metagenome]